MSWLESHETQQEQMWRPAAETGRPPDDAPFQPKWFHDLSGAQEITTLL